ncbi:uncharacterized protein LOC117784218 [Drosophila innubila]|uniref:uncharacterized protein LOC117784218 n=1 Tax=Drosophila innubila TaxID=198719 RepID=UPI00148B8FE4|nr:uncharacterized protein LOC117784218 [Drosophila innubila]
MLNVVVAVVLLATLGLSQAQFASPSRYYLPPVASESAAPSPQPPIITKQFFSVSAAEDVQDVQPRNKHLVIGRATRNYRVIFIRAPTAQSEAIKYTAELAPQEERTVIYVLSRKQQELEAQDIQTSKQQETPAKPEIFFIRYKTNEEAAAAQREIQTQYDELGGNTEHAAPFVAPVQSVVGALDAAMPPNVAAPLVPPAEGYDYQRPMMARLFR